jgi:hypothetical protein
VHTTQHRHHHAHEVHGLLRAAHEQLRERLAVQQLHDQEQRAFVPPHVEHVHHVRMIDVAGGLCFAQQALRLLFVAHHFRLQPLDGHVLAREHVRCCEHHAHTALAEYTVEPVLVGNYVSEVGLHRSLTRSSR